MALSKHILLMDKEVLELGKSFAPSQGLNLSQLVERLIKDIARNQCKPKGEIQSSVELMLLFPPKRIQERTPKKYNEDTLGDYHLAHQRTYYSIEEE
jgi:hypothetical protein